MPIRFRFSGSVQAIDGTVIYERVSGEARVAREAIVGPVPAENGHKEQYSLGLRYWSGTLVVESGESLDTFLSDGFLVVDSGRRATIHVQRMDSASRSIQFLGGGEPPFDCPEP